MSKRVKNEYEPDVVTPPGETLQQTMLRSPRLWLSKWKKCWEFLRVFGITVNGVIVKVLPDRKSELSAKQDSVGMTPQEGLTDIREIRYKI